MYCKIFLAASLLAAAVAANANDEAVSILVESSNMDRYIGPEAPRPLHAPTSLSVGNVEPPRPSNTADNGNLQVLDMAAQKGMVVSAPHMTAVEHFLDEDASLKYLPKPSPMPTTTPKYPTNMAAHLSSAIAANKASILAHKASTSHDSHWSSKLSQLQATIAALQEDISAANVALSLASVASKTQAAKLRSESAAYLSAMHARDELTGHKSGKKSAASLSASPNLKILLVAGLGIAGLRSLL